MKKLFMGFLISITVLCSSSMSQAITLSFSPVSQYVNMGDTADVDLIISGLGDLTAPSLGAYDLNIIYDPAILLITGITFGDPVLGNQLDIWGLGDNDSGFANIASGTDNIFEISYDLPYDLDDYQADSFALATLTFNTLQTGISPLNLSVNSLSDAWGDSLTATTQTGSIAVVPEPASTVLFGTGLAVFLFLRRKRNSQKDC